MRDYIVAIIVSIISGTIGFYQGIQYNQSNTNKVQYQKSFVALYEIIYDLSFANDKLFLDVKQNKNNKILQNDYSNIENVLYSYIKQVYLMGSLVSNSTFCILYDYDKSTSDLIEKSNKPFTKKDIDLNIPMSIISNTLSKHLLLTKVNWDNQKNNDYSQRLIKYDVESCKDNDPIGYPNNMFKLRYDS